VQIPIGEQKFDFTIYFSQAFPTNGGYMFDCAVVHEERVSADTDTSSCVIG
jgi:hypothetical protein